MKKIINLLVLLVCLVQMAFCSKEEKSISSVDKNFIMNNGFEADKTKPINWDIVTTNVNTASIQEGGYSGSYCLELKYPSPYETTVSQNLSGIADGIYSLQAWVENSGGQEACYLFARNKDGVEKITSLPVTNNWAQVIVSGVDVINGQLTIGIYTKANDNNWCRLDEINIVKDDHPYSFLKGGDISELNYVESKGGKFYENGNEENCLDILKNNGFNIVRLRLYNDPGNPNFSPSNRLPTGFQNPSDILNLAKRAKNAGMKILLTFHYSDYWTNPSGQSKPHEWENLTYNDLKNAVYNFTYDFMMKMKDQGTIPEFVALGNETDCGILFPDGSYQNFAKLTELYNQGYNAVKAVSPESKVIIHLSDAGNQTKYDWYFGELNENGAKYDIIGASYYPFWTNKTSAEIREWANYENIKFNKDIFIMETGYNWNPTLPSGYAGQLSNNGPYEDIYPSTPLGQKNFLLELFNEIKKAKNRCIVGCLYWDPIMIEVPGVGWEIGAPNVVSNTTLFDFSGNALEAFDAFKYNN
jgi:arabinogalactan endo-1,4-beta-galactosidase